MGDKYLKSAFQKQWGFKIHLMRAARKAPHINDIYAAFIKFGYGNVKYVAGRDPYGFQESISIHDHEYYYNYGHSKVNAKHPEQAKYTNFNKYSNQMMRKRFLNKSHKNSKFIDMS